jgi:DNA-binding response OmpR family regulator
MPVNGIYKVLMIDDSVSLVKLMGSILGRKNYNVIEAFDAETGMFLAESEAPDIVLLDISLPRIDGITACKIIKEKHPHLPIIIYTGLLDPAKKLAAYDAGADDFIMKPVSGDQIVSHIRHLLHLSSL